MSLFSAKYFIAALAVIVALGFALGGVWYNHDTRVCVVQRNWSLGQWHTVWAIGRLEFRYRDIDYGCSERWHLDHFSG